MPGIGFILMHVFLVVISQDVLATSIALDHVLAEDVLSASDEDSPDLRISNVYLDEDKGDTWGSLFGREGEVSRPYRQNSNGQRRTSRMNRLQKCSCTYGYSNRFIKARLGHRLLKKGDSIMQGETVSFECRYINTVMMWANGLQFHGRANMTCNTCEEWQLEHLPSCRSADQTYVVLGQEDDLAVLPGGIVQLQAGQSRRFSCSNIQSQPEWFYLKKDGISVTEAQDWGEGETIFVSYLDIINAEDKHSGIYRCFSRAPDHNRDFVNTFLSIEVVTKSENDETPSSTSPKTRVSPTESTTSKTSWESSSTTSRTSWEIPDENNLECSCEYYSGDDRVSAFVGDKRLEIGDTIRHGDTVSFECGRRHVLSWENGLRYQGKARMTCSKCEVWTDTDLPTCRLLPLRRYTLIRSEKELTFLPGGILQMKEGESHNISCVSARSKPQWKYETKDNVKEGISSRTPNSYRSPLEIQHVRYENKGKYECIAATGESVVLNLEVDRKSISPANCSKFPDSLGLRVLYSGFSVGSTARMMCLIPSGELTVRYSICLYGGTWSNPAPVCEAPAVLNCSKFPDYPGLRVYYSGLSVGSTARFRCVPSSRKLSGSSNSTCLQGGTWSNPAPKCEASALLNCSKFPDYPGLRVDYSGLSVGNTARFQCFPSSRKLSGSSNSTCLQGGTWSNPAPMCEAPKCSIEDLVISLPDFVIPDMPIMINEFSPGSEVQLKCVNFIAEGDSKAVCGEYGQWKVGNIKCVPGCRLDVNPASKLLVEPRKDNYRMGEFVFLWCPLNYHLSTNVERLMCLSDRWSDNLPECVQDTD